MMAVDEEDCCLGEEVVPRLEQVNALRLSRSQCVRLLSRKDTSADDLECAFRGCFVRVLLETAAGPAATSRGQLYRIARIEGTQQGDAYGGYSNQEDVTTTYLSLDVASSAQGAPHASRRGTIQLNSISNSDFTTSEYNEWLSRRRLNGGVPSVADLAPKCRELVAILGDHHTSRGPLMETSRLDYFCGRAPVTSEGKKRRIQPPPRGCGVGMDAEPSQLQRALQIAQRTISVQSQEIAELRRKLGARLEFPKDLDPLEPNSLFDLEEQVGDYLAQVRQRRRDLNQCKVCMAKESEVVLLPCRHQAMCRDCEKRMTICPMCRTPIEDRIYPHRS
eukprot:Hpha_TRINITY_DN16182_c1_g8::TRINITY_DN16182_c1_g8_i1::g.8095::m.8095